MTDHVYPLDLSSFDYPLDPALIAVEPKAKRDESRLLVYHRKRQRIEHRHFSDISEYLSPRDLLVFNNSRVFPARLYGEKKNGGKTEFLFLRPAPKQNHQTQAGFHYWEALVRGKSAPQTDLLFPEGVSGRITRDLEGGRKEVMIALSPDRYKDLFSFLEKWGEVPLPPYIVKRRNAEKILQKTDKGRYQTVYADEWGSAAAPTAGLHFTDALIHKIKTGGTETATTTLHIGLDTFLPIRTETITEHRMHSEWIQVSSETVEKIKQARAQGGKVFAVGTTVTRALESAARGHEMPCAMEGDTDIFIKPGHVFKGIDALITNFHLPKSTLLVMIAAFAGLDTVKHIYAEAIRYQYRFYSYGDAMLIL
ncbi:S-adenosylmethionine:tRNA ribosyltransferase-isomerase [hydrothermal vent metagenome]|uniref:S-adenosylmethionine:tRNA ribosyltransferase-isomerase n=1 Tax=hydrothermal vent metagenome TaxID=652676 RepID=A0A3B1D665_9ZZZZ